MGREIRKVSADWEHPHDRLGNFQPMYDGFFDDAARKWLDNCIAWDNGTHKDLRERPELKEEYPFYWQWSSEHPDPEYYKPSEWKGKPLTHFQIYETVSEGTPVSPPFKTKKEVIEWLVNGGSYNGYQQGPYTRNAAENFVEMEWAPSMMVYPGVGIKEHIASCADFPSRGNGEKP